MVVGMQKTLVVDLDGTLLKSDLLFESFWSAFGRDWQSPFRSALYMFQGKASLKRYLAQAADVDVKTLPYDAEVISYIKAWRNAGGRVALVTASDENIAREISSHLRLFDEIYGSNGNENLKGERKARFLIDKYGEKQFSYMGDSKADLAVWKHANRAITVNLSQSMQKRAAHVAEEVEHLKTISPSFASFFAAIRPHQWVKNALVFLPMFAAHQTQWPIFFLSLLAFISFSLISSSVYVLNDLLDLKSDREHPRKRMRPFAAGRIPIAAGTWMSAGLLAIGSAIAVFLGPAFFSVMAVYYVLTTAYSLFLKQRIVVDIFVLAGLYTLRIVAGGVATSIPLSVWLLAFSIFFFLSLAAVKRQVELVDNVKQGKSTVSGRGYHVDDLPVITMISLSAGYVAVLVMSLYINSPVVVELYASPAGLWGVCAILLYWITRTVMLAHRGEMHDDPVVYAATDRLSQLCFLVIIALVISAAAL